MSERYNFKYLPLVGKLPGKSMVEQTETAINELASVVYDNVGHVGNLTEEVQTANTNASNALDKATEALETSSRVYIKQIAAVDVNDYYDSELYYIDNDGSTNIPVRDRGFLEVKTNDDKTACEQVFIADSTGTPYYRHGRITEQTLGEETTYVVTWSGWSSQPASQAYVQGELTNYLPLSGGTLTGVVNGVTPPNGDNSKKLATTAFVNATAQQADWAVTDTTSKAYIKNKPNIYAVKEFQSSDNGGRPKYLLLYDITNFVSGYIGPTGFQGVITVTRAGGYQPANLTGLLDVTIQHKGTLSEDTSENALHLYSSRPDLVLPVVIRNNNKYYLALRLNYSSYVLRFNGYWSGGTPLLTEVLFTSATTPPDGYEEIKKGKELPFYASNATADAAGNNIQNTYAKKSDLSTAVPIGVVQAFAGSTIPSGWLLCDGSAVSRTDYAALYAVIGTTYGAGNGSTTFNLPNLVDKFIEGSATAGTVKSAGLPNITGTGTYYTAWSSPSGAVYTKSSGDNHYNGDGTRLGQDIWAFDASRSNSIYGKSNTVQPPALTMRYIIKY